MAETDEQAEGPRPRRRSDAWLARLLGLSIGVNLLSLLVLALVSVGVLGNSAKISDVEDAARQAKHAAKAAKGAALGLEAEAGVRVDATCKLFERQHREAVKDVTDVYDFLRGDHAAENPSLVQLALEQIGPKRDAARDARAPRYCDAPGVGLREPNPELPPPPEGLPGPP